MRIETEIEALTVGSLRGLLAQADRNGAGSDAAVSFMRRRGDGGYVVRVEFEPVGAPPVGVPQVGVYLRAEPSDASDG